MEYFSTTTILVEPFPVILQNSADMSDLQQERTCGGLLQIKQKRRNGRIRKLMERFDYTPFGLSFGPPDEVEPVKSTTGRSTIPKVQFNLALTEKELKDRAKVVLPFEHQGNGQEAKIYDGRDNIRMSYLALQLRDVNLAEGPKDTTASDGKEFGEIHYLRDSDDERPDSDEDPDDDLDI